MAKQIIGVKRPQSQSLDLNQFKLHFEKLLNPGVTQINYLSAEPLIKDDELDREISMEELEFALKCYKERKAPGINGIPNEFYKYGSESLRKNLLRVMNIMFHESCIPEDSLIGLIFPLFKKGDKSRAENYRGITFLNADLKIPASRI